MKRHIHFIGIGGIGVSGIAQLALKKGEIVSGSDVKDSAITQRLSRMGAKVSIGHQASHVDGADLVVYSSAIRPDNPEMIEARSKGLLIKKRAEYLSELMADKKGITITGAHGKTTTSSLAAKLLLAAGLHPMVAVGGILCEDGDNAKFGASDYFVAEADESDGTFLCYTPTYSIITNIDHEHMDFYKTYDNLLSSFSAFVRQTKDSGCIFYFFEDEPLRRIVEKSGVRAVSFGYTSRADYYPDRISLAQGHLSFEAQYPGKSLGIFSLQLTGKHNILNALAVIALGLELRIEPETIRAALADFKGVQRRFQVKYSAQDLLVVDDYGHHPTEIAATIEAAKACSRRRVVVVFQPHRYSRTQLLMDQFPKSFAQSDYVIITDIYAASEDPIAGVSAEVLADRVKSEAGVDTHYVAKNRILQHLKEKVKNNDLVLFLGAGDITKLSDEFASFCQKKS